MNSRQKKNIIIISLTLILGISATILLLTNTNTTIEQKFHVEDIASVTRIYMEDKDNKHVELARNGQTAWIINQEWDASVPFVGILLETLEQMRVREPIARAAHPQVIRNLSTRSTRIDIYQQRYRIHLGSIRLFPHEVLTKSIYVGGETPDNMGTYMLLKGQKEPCIVYIPSHKGFLTTRFNTNAEIWRSHEICAYPPSQIASIRIEIPEDPSESFEIYKDDETFHFHRLSQTENETHFDTLKATALISSFSQLNFEAYATDISQLQRDTIFAKLPSFQITVASVDGDTTKLKTYLKLSDPHSFIKPTDESNFYEIFDINRTFGVIENRADTVFLQYFVVDNILKPASYYLD